MSNLHQTVRAWDGSYYEPRITSEQAVRFGHVAVAGVLALGLFYCGSIAWDVLHDLREVKLVEIRTVLYRVSVGDAVLSWVAYVCGRDLLRSLLQRDRL
ncbi:MAG: hypothetical protein FJ148_16360 [Deltaproteobacteria bacterium]|nr:hypothetical protein [Deltaproteobacteria bacterium]